VDECDNLAFVGITMNAGPFAKLVYQIKKEDDGLYRVGDESSVIRLPLGGKL